MNIQVLLDLIPYGERVRVFCTTTKKTYVEINTVDFKIQVVKECHNSEVLSISPVNNTLWVTVV